MIKEYQRFSGYDSWKDFGIIQAMKSWRLKLSLKKSSKNSSFGLCAHEFNIIDRNFNVVQEYKVVLML
jgi:hypothetical protein